MGVIDTIKDKARTAYLKEKGKRAAYKVIYEREKTKHQIEKTRSDAKAAAKRDVYGTPRRQVTMRRPRQSPIRGGTRTMRTARRKRRAKTKYVYVTKRPVKRKKRKKKRSKPKHMFDF